MSKWWSSNTAIALAIVGLVGVGAIVRLVNGPDASIKDGDHDTREVRRSHGPLRGHQDFEVELDRRAHEGGGSISSHTQGRFFGVDLAMPDAPHCAGITIAVRKAEVSSCFVYVCSVDGAPVDSLVSRDGDWLATSATHAPSIPECAGE